MSLSKMKFLEGSLFDVQLLKKSTRFDKAMNDLWRYGPFIEEINTNTILLSFKPNNFEITLKYSVDTMHITMEIEGKLKYFSLLSKIDDAITLSTLSLQFLFVGIPLLQNASLDVLYYIANDYYCLFHWEEAENYTSSAYNEYIIHTIEQKSYDYDSVTSVPLKKIEFYSKHPAYYTTNVDFSTMNSSFQQLVSQLDYFEPFSRDTIVKGVNASIHGFNFLIQFPHYTWENIKIKFYYTKEVLDSTYFDRNEILDLIPSCDDVALVLYITVLYYSLLQHTFDDRKNEIIIKLIQSKNTFPTLVNKFLKLTIDIGNVQKFLSMDPSIPVCSLMQQKLDLLDVLISMFAVEYPEQVLE